MVTNNSDVKSSSVHPCVELAQKLVQVESVTPNDSGCQEIIKTLLVNAGFKTETMIFEGVTNLWAVRGDSRPSIVFVGHTDVVSPGPIEKWKYPPYDGIISNGLLYGRGSADMKGGIASFVTAVERFVKRNPNHKGSIGFIITSDEEGRARWGTREVVNVLCNKRGIVFDLCIVGEPASQSRLGDIVKIGRRGSIGADLTIHGIQGHIAYPHLARNPIHEAIGALYDLVHMKWDNGDKHFEPTSFQISNINAGTGATNVIPGFKKVHFNFRYAPVTTFEDLKKRVEAVLDSHELKYGIEWEDNHDPYYTDESELVEAALQSIKKVTGLDAQPCTSGGTSDGRFVAKTGAQVIELGPVSASIHKVDEHVLTSDLETLSDIYEDLLFRLLNN